MGVTYSYWDGSGHRRNLTVKKGDSIGGFLKAVRDQLAPTFREMRTANVGNLMFVKARAPRWAAAVALSCRVLAARARRTTRVHPSALSRPLRLRLLPHCPPFPAASTHTLAS